MSQLTFSNSDKERIKEAVGHLEKESSGELVIYFAKGSHQYSNATWKLSVLFGILTLLSVMVLSYLWLLPEAFSAIIMSGVTLLMMALGFAIASFFPKLRVSLIQEDVVTQAVITKARDIFLQEEVFKTIDRTGILIYISELEHEVVVLGDTGINEKIGDKDWLDVVQKILDGIKSGRTADGIIDAIGQCKTLLLDNGFVVRADDTNELPDDIRIEE
jgi:putative membrane protein